MWVRFGPDLAVIQPERHAGQEDTVEEALEDRRIAEVPDREGQDQRFGGPQAVDIVADGCNVGGLDRDRRAVLLRSAPAESLRRSGRSRRRPSRVP